MKTMRPYLPNKTRRIRIPDEARELAQPDRYTVRVTFDPDNGYVARVEEMPGLVVAEDTQAALDVTLPEAMALYIAAAMRRGRPVPAPPVVAR
jgi:predicted RNase H-like HicB family nuclease